MTGETAITRSEIINAVRSGNTSGIDKSFVRQLKKQGVVECQTCASRKYQDGSDENVSFKSAAHIAPQASAAVVRGHEAQHVSNAYKSAAQSDGRVICASVSVRNAICPECGRSYTAGGVTNTMIKYNESNPYIRGRKTADYPDIAGANINYTA